MYEKFFQFTEPPFNLTPDPRFFFFSKKHLEAFDHIRYGIHERKGFIVVTGEIGTGKTTLSRLLLGKLEKKIRTALIFNPSLNTIELLQAINDGFGLPSGSTSKKVLVGELNQLLLKSLSEGGNALLIIDEGQNLSIECLEEIRMLSNLETEKEKLLQILLIGQPELRDKLLHPELRQLNQRITIRYHVEPLSLEETKAYVSYRLKVAGGRERLFFTPKALLHLHRQSEGIPRLINTLCDKALHAAFSQQSLVVDHAAVAQGAGELEGLMMTSRGKPDREKRRYGQGARPIHRPVYRSGFFRFTPIGKAVIGVLLTLLLATVWGGTTGFFERVQGLVALEKMGQPGALSPADASARVVASVSSPTFEEVQVRPPVERVVEEEIGSVFSGSVVWDGLFDSNGVFRVGLAEETEKAALLTLLRVWGITWNPSREEFADLDLKQLTSLHGLSAYRFPTDLEQIRVMDFPCLIPGRWNNGTAVTYAVLVDLADTKATVLDPLKGRVTYDLSVLKKLWSGEGQVYWRSLPGIRLPLRTQGFDPSVKALQKALRSEGLHLGKVDGFLGTNTRRAIRFFKQKNGLQESGPFDLESYMILSRVMLGEAPSLQVGGL